jgi:LuxR family transcriptional regulator, maltose regulon positive regulatory protein
MPSATDLTSADVAAVGSSGPDACASRDALTRTEQEVLSLVARGLFNQEIAAQLGIVVGTVKWHLHQIFAKLGARNRTEAVARARDRGALASRQP